MPRLMVTARGLILFLTGLWLSGCGPSTPASFSATERKGALEAELLRTPASTDTRTTLRRSRLLRALGQQEQAQTELSAAVDAAREQLVWTDLARLWREVGIIHVERGEPERALDVFGKSLKAAVALDEGLPRASALVDTGYAFALLGHLGQAHDAVTEAQVLGGDELLADPVSVEHLGIISELLNDAAKARSLLQAAADGYRTRGDTASSARAQVLVGRIVARDDDDPTALSQLEATVAPIPDAGPLALLRRYQAELDHDGHNYDACERRAVEALELADARGLQRVSKIARVLAAACGDQNGHLDDAITYAREAGSIVELELRNVSGDRTRQHLSYEAFLIYRMLLPLEAKKKSSDRVARAFITSERARARSHLDAMARHQLGKLAATLPVNSALQQGRAEAQARIKRVTQALLNADKRKNLRKEQRDALWALEDINEAIARSNPLLSRVAPAQAASIEEVREQLLGEDGLLLSYFVSKDHTYLFAIDQQGEVLEKLASSPEEIAQAVRRYRKRVLLDTNTTQPAIAKAGKKLFDMVFGPVQARLEGKKRLIIVPHGPLSSLPFESLVDGHGKYLVQTHDIVYTVSATVAVLAKKREAPDGSRKSFVGVGDPVYDWAAFKSGRAEGSKVASTRALELWDAASEDAAGKARGLERLPGTARELRAIAKLFGSDQKLYLRAQASEEVVKNGGLGGYRIVHIASHGMLGRRYQALALSLPPHQKEDGFLMNSEIAELDLHAADLVVLSACRTGVSNKVLAGEPVVGLTLSLRSAGARQVVLSLWSVDDDATADLMLEFYRPLVKEGADYAASMAAAKRKMIALGKWRHPFYWAAFVLHGT